MTLGNLRMNVDESVDAWNLRVRTALREAFLTDFSETQVLKKFVAGAVLDLKEKFLQDEWGKYLSCFAYLYGRTTCELDETASNYPLTMLRGFGYSSLELFLFWWNLFRTAREEGVKGLLVYLQIGAESKRAAKRQKTSRAMSEWYVSPHNDYLEYRLTVCCC
ncbi:hypothetical protein QOT17_024606 [Balamuthia mandrillaris]